jgi:hypothetical protein
VKKTWFIAGALLLVSFAGFAQAPSRAPLTREALAMILGQPAASCATRPAKAALPAAKRPQILPGKSLCSATANCDTGTVTCQGNNSTTSCSAADRNCDIGERGHVTCDGVTTSCATACPAPCSTGTIRERQCCQCGLTGDCFACCRCEGGSLFQCSEGCN